LAAQLLDGETGYDGIGREFDFGGYCCGVSCRRMVTILAASRVSRRMTLDVSSRASSTVPSVSRRSRKSTRATPRKPV
jgi:hypothetical protein